MNKTIFIVLMAGALAAFGSACTDDTGGGGDPANNDPANNDPVNNDPVNNDPVNNDPVNNDPVNNDPVNNDPVNNDPVNEDIALCQTTCTEVAACPGLVELCSEDILAEVEAGCQQGCEEDEDARAQILAAAGLPCDVVEPLAIDGFGLQQLCGDFEPSEDLQAALDAAATACEAGCNAYAGDQCLGDDLPLEGCLEFCDYETFFAEEFFDLEDETAIACANAFLALEVCLEVLSCEDITTYFTTEDLEADYPCKTEDQAIETDCEAAE